MTAVQERNLNLFDLIEAQGGAVKTCEAIGADIGKLVGLTIVYVIVPLSLFLFNKGKELVTYLANKDYSFVTKYFETPVNKSTETPANINEAITALDNTSLESFIPVDVKLQKLVMDLNEALRPLATSDYSEEELWQLEDFTYLTADVQAVIASIIKLQQFIQRRLIDVDVPEWFLSATPDEIGSFTPTQILLAITLLDDSEQEVIYRNYNE